MEPLLIEVPDRLETDRLVMRVPRPGDGRIAERRRSALRTTSSRRGCRGPARCRRSTSRRRIAGVSRRASCCARTSSCCSSCAMATVARASSSAAPACTGSTGHCASSRSATGARPVASGEASSPRRCGRWRGSRSTRSTRAGSRSAWTTATSAAGSSPSAPASRWKRCCASTRSTPAGEPRSTRIYARVRGAEEPMGVERA